MLKILLLLLISTASYGQESVQEFAQIYYSRTSLSGEILKEDSFLLTELSNSRQRLLTQAKSEEQKLIIEAYTENIFANIQNQKKLSKEWVKKLDLIYDKIVLYSELQTNLSPEFLTMRADFRSQIMGYRGLSTLIKMAKQNLKDYELAIVKDKTYFPAYMGLGLSFYFAPKIGGGDVNLSLKYFDIAEKYANNNLKKFQLYLWRSQVYLRKKEKEKSEQELARAELIFPDNSLLKSIKTMNQKGKHFK